VHFRESTGHQKEHFYGIEDVHLEMATFAERLHCRGEDIAVKKTCVYRSIKRRRSQDEKSGC